jgi:chemotaxis protein MotB
VLSDSLNAAFRGQPHTMDPIQVGYKVVRVKRDDNPAGLSPSQAMKLPGKPGHAQTSVAEQFGKAGLHVEGTEGTGRPLARQIEEAMATLINRDLVQVTRQPLWVEVQIKADVLFPSGSAEMQAPAIEILQGIAAVLKPLPSPIRVEGHTDNRPISTAMFPSNWELSGARAARIVRMFQTLGIAPDRMSVAGLADQQPIADNATEDGRNRNRRVTLIILDTATGDAADPADAKPAAAAAAPAAPEAAP